MPGGAPRPREVSPAKPGTELLNTTVGLAANLKLVQNSILRVSNPPDEGTVPVQADPRAVIERAWPSWPRLVWSSARLTARIFMQRRRVGERPLLPLTGRSRLVV
jgi:hypothetical protein